MNKISIFLSFLLLTLSMTLYAQSDNQASYERAQSEYSKGYYAKARTLCTKILATGDIKFTAKCQAMIADIDRIQSEREGKSDYINVPSIICLPYDVSSQDIKVSASGAWSAHSNDSWIKTTVGRKTLTVAAVEKNESSCKKTSTVTVECGEVTSIITVEQEGAPEILEYRSKYLKVPYTGGRFIVDINTNTDWIADYSDWYKAAPLNGDSTRMVILIDKNTKNDERTGTIVVRSFSGCSDRMEIYQYPNESVIFAALDESVRSGTYMIL